MHVCKTKTIKLGKNSLPKANTQLNNDDGEREIQVPLMHFVTLSTALHVHVHETLHFLLSNIMYLYLFYYDL